MNSLINYRTYIALLANGLFNMLVQYGIIDLTNPIVSKETLEVVITTLLLLLAAVFRKYAGQQLPFFNKAATPPEGGKP